MQKQDQLREEREDLDAVIDMGAASEVTLTIGNFSLEVNLEPRVWKD